MARRREQKSQGPVRHSIAAAVLSLLPLLAFAGVLAPGLVDIDYNGDQSQEAARKGTIVFRPVRLSRPPLMVTRGAGAGFLLEFLDIEALFQDGRFRGEAGQRLAQLQSIPSANGDLIVIDDVDATNIVMGKSDVFEDVLRPSFVADGNPLWDPKVFDVIPPLFAIGNGFRFDDFPDPGFVPGKAPTTTVIPEPETAALLGFGLVGLARCGRRRELA
jgi:hypothetical protein